MKVNGRSAPLACGLVVDRNSRHAIHKIQATAISFSVLAKAGWASKSAPIPKAVSPAVIPTPTATPAICGKVGRTPNRAPEAVSKMTFGPGENSPAKTKR